MKSLKGHSVDNTRIISKVYIVSLLEIMKDKKILIFLIVIAIGTLSIIVCFERKRLEQRIPYTAITEKSWLIEMWHNVMPEDDGGYQTFLIKDAEKHLDYMEEKAASGAIWVATYTEAVKYIRERQNVSVKAYIDCDTLHIFAELTNPKMSYKTFNQPLTVLFTLPNEYSEQGITMVNVVPGKETVMKLVGE